MRCLPSSPPHSDRIRPEDHHIRQEMNEPRREEPPCFQHGLSKKPAEKPRHEKSSPAGRGAVKAMGESEENRGDQERVGFTDGPGQCRKNRGPKVQFFVEGVDRGATQNCWKKRNGTQQNPGRRTHGKNGRNGYSHSCHNGEYPSKRAPGLPLPDAKP